MKPIDRNKIIEECRQAILEYAGREREFIREYTKMEDLNEAARAETRAIALHSAATLLLQLKKYKTKKAGRT